MGGMIVPRFFIAGSNINGGSVFVTGEDAEHMRVLRLKLGDIITLCDEKGTDHTCRITRMGPDGCEAEVTDSAPCEAEPDVEVTILAGMPQGERADFIVQKCTEAGAKRIVFFLCERCVARPD